MRYSVLTIVAGTALAMAGCQTPAPNPDPYTGAGIYTGGTIGQSYEARLAEEVGAASVRCIEQVGETPDTIGHHACVLSVLGTPQVGLADFVVVPDGRWEPVLWLDEQWSRLSAYRHRFVRGGDELHEFMDRQTAFLARQRDLNAMRATLSPVQAAPDF